MFVMGGVAEASAGLGGEGAGASGAGRGRGRRALNDVWLWQRDAVNGTHLRASSALHTAAGERRAPTDAELQAWLAAHPGDYRRDAQIALQQVFLGEDPARADVDRVLESLRAAPDTRFAALGRRSMLPPKPAHPIFCSPINRSAQTSDGC